MNSFGLMFMMKAPLLSKLYLVALIMINAPYSTDLQAQLLVEGEQDLSGLHTYRDINYIESAIYADDKDKLDIFMPEGQKDIPVILFFHGGALKAGTKLDGEALAARMKGFGIGVVSANYRLTPTVQHPGHVNDAAAAFAWAKENIHHYGGDPSRIYLSGHSSGAYLAVLLAMDPAHLQKQGLKIEAIKGVLPISPFLYVEETAKDRPKDVWGEDPNDWYKASVSLHIKSGKPPMLMIYADGDEDWRREQNERFVTEMKSVGNESIDSLEVTNRDHFTIITHMNNEDDNIRDAILTFVNTD